MEPLNIFTDETLTKDVFIDNITAVGSAFGGTVEGEAVFINSRIVSALKLKHGDCVKAFVLPNYEDKRDRVRWRAIRVEVQGSMSDGKGIPDPSIDSLADTMTKTLGLVPRDEQIVNLLDEHGPLRTSTLSRLLGIDSGEVGTLCHGLYAQGRIALADIYSSPGNKRASHRVWAININDFDVDPFEEDDDRSTE
jgi:hypothetical protein